MTDGATILTVAAGALALGASAVKLAQMALRRDKPRNDSNNGNNGNSGDKSTSYWIREFEKVVAPVLELLRKMDTKLDELLRRKR